MTNEHLLSGVFEWFWLQPDAVRPFRAADHVCSQLYRQYYPGMDPTLAKYQLLYPLLRRGVIEFYGEGKLGLAPSIALTCKGSRVLTNIIPPLDLAKADQPHAPFFYELDHSMETLGWLNSRNITLLQFSFADSIGAVPSFEKIIGGWTPDQEGALPEYVYFDGNNNWSRNMGSDHPGILKKTQEDYAQKVFLLKSGKAVVIPSSSENIDAFNIAVVCSQMYNHWDIGIRYWKGSKKLSVSNIFFPIVIERMLAINSIIHGCDLHSLSNREYIIGHSDFAFLNKLFSLKIKTL